MYSIAPVLMVRSKISFNVVDAYFSRNKYKEKKITSAVIPPLVYSHNKEALAQQRNI